MRNYKNQTGRKNAKYDPKHLTAAINSVKENKMSLRKASECYAIAYSTLRNHIQDKPMKTYGGQTVLTSDEEDHLERIILSCSDWRLPLKRKDIILIIQSYLTTIGKCTRFRDNKPGRDWWEGYLKRHQKLSEKWSQNIKRVRANVGEEAVKDYFDHLKTSMEGIPGANILNYDETNFVDDPGAELVSTYQQFCFHVPGFSVSSASKNSKTCFLFPTQVVTRRGSRHPDSVKDTTRSATSVMFCCTAAGHLLPPFIVYKANKAHDAWTENGPPGAKYSATDSGWFEMDTFEEWFMKIALVYMKTLVGPKLLIGDNLASHLSPQVVQACWKYDIRFVFFTPNATHILQPLDVAVFRSLKRKWREILNEWKDKHYGPLHKSVFPRLLKDTIEAVGMRNSENIKAGFRGTGIHPFNPERVLSKVRIQETSPDTLSLDNTVVQYLKERREAVLTTTPKRTRKIKVIPGQGGYPNFQIFPELFTG